MSPPDLCGFTAVPNLRLDQRWEAVKDRPLGVRLSRPGRFTKAQKLVNERLIYTAEGIDHWDAPQAAWDIGRGDCEEYALCKRAILLASGIPDEDLFFVLVNDLDRHAPHALLIARQGESSYLMDITGDICRVENAKDFMPCAAFTGSAGWLYGRKV